MNQEEMMGATACDTGDEVLHHLRMARAALIEDNLRQIHSHHEDGAEFLLHYRIVLEKIDTSILWRQHLLQITAPPINEEVPAPS